MPEKQMIYTIVQTAVDADHGFFPDPIALGSYPSVDLARKELADRIAEAKETLSGRYDTEESSEDSWEAYQDGYAAACFMRIEILTSELAPAPKGGPLDA